MHWISPRAKAGLNMLLASSDPLAPPAPTMVWISSMNKITSGDFSSSFITAFMRSSNWPRYFVPATNEATSRVTMRLLKSTRDTFFSMMRKARPSAMALLPTPGSPMRMGLFFFRRLKIWDTRSISFWRPTIGSKRPSSAIFVKSRPKLSNTGVLLFGSAFRPALPAPLLPEPPPMPGMSSSSSPIPVDSARGFKSERTPSSFKRFSYSSFATSYSMLNA